MRNFPVCGLVVLWALSACDVEAAGVSEPDEPIAADRNELDGDDLNQVIGSYTWSFSRGRSFHADLLDIDGTKQVALWIDSNLCLRYRTVNVTSKTLGPETATGYCRVQTLTGNPNFAARSSSQSLCPGQGLTSDYKYKNFAVFNAEDANGNRSVYRVTFDACHGVIANPTFALVASGTSSGPLEEPTIAWKGDTSGSGLVVWARGGQEIRGQAFNSSNNLGSSFQVVELDGGYLVASRVFYNDYSNNYILAYNVDFGLVSNIYNTLIDGSTFEVAYPLQFGISDGDGAHGHHTAIAYMKQSADGRYIWARQDMDSDKHVYVHNAYGMPVAEFPGLTWEMTPSLSHGASPSAAAPVRYIMGLTSFIKGLAADGVSWPILDTSATGYPVALRVAANGAVVSLSVPSFTGNPPPLRITILD